MCVLKSNHVYMHVFFIHADCSFNNDYDEYYESFLVFWLIMLMQIATLQLRRYKPFKPFTKPLHAMQ